MYAIHQPIIVEQPEPITPPHRLSLPRSQFFQYYA